jgi:hypothetical protein
VRLLRLRAACTGEKNTQLQWATFHRAQTRTRAATTHHIVVTSPLCTARPPFPLTISAIMSTPKSKSKTRSMLKDGWYCPFESSRRSLPRVEPAFISVDQSCIIPSKTATLEDTFMVIQGIDRRGARQQAVLYRWLGWLYLLCHPDQTAETREKHWSYILEHSSAGRDLRTSQSQSRRPSDAHMLTRVFSGLLVAYWIHQLSVDVPEIQSSPEDDYQNGFYTINDLARLRTAVLDDEGKMRRLLPVLGQFKHTSIMMERVANHIDSNENSDEDHLVVEEPASDVDQSESSAESCSGNSSSSSESDEKKKKKKQKKKTKKKKKTEEKEKAKKKKNKKNKAKTSPRTALGTVKEVHEGPRDSDHQFRVSMVNGKRMRWKTLAAIKALNDGERLLDAHLERQAAATQTTSSAPELQEELKSDSQQSRSSPRFKQANANRSSDNTPDALNTERDKTGDVGGDGAGSARDGDVADDAVQSAADGARGAAAGGGEADRTVTSAAGGASSTEGDLYPEVDVGDEDDTEAGGGANGGAAASEHASADGVGEDDGSSGDKADRAATSAADRADDGAGFSAVGGGAAGRHHSQRQHCEPKDRPALFRHFVSQAFGALESDEFEDTRGYIDEPVIRAGLVNLNRLLSTSAQEADRLAFLPSAPAMQRHHHYKHPDEDSLDLPIKSCKTLAAPVWISTNENSGGHWALLVLQRGEGSDTIWCLDSLRRGKPSSYYEHLKTHLHSLVVMGQLKAKHTIRCLQVTQQKDPVSCGLFLLRFAIYIAATKNWQQTIESQDFDVAHMRPLLVQLKERWETMTLSELNLHGVSPRVNSRPQAVRAPDPAPTAPAPDAETQPASSTPASTPSTVVPAQGQSPTTKSARERELEADLQRALTELRQLRAVTAPVGDLSSGHGRSPAARTLTEPVVASSTRVDRLAILAELRKQSLESDGRLTVSAVAYFMELLNYHRQRTDQLHHAYCFRPTINDSNDLPASDPTAEKARYWLVPRSEWLDVYDRVTNQVFRLDPAADSQSDRPDIPQFVGVPVTNMPVPHRVPKNTASFGDWIIAYALAISCPGWYPKCDLLSHVLLWEREKLVRFIRDGNVQDPPRAELKPTKEQEELRRLREENQRLKQQFGPQRVKVLEQMEEVKKLLPENYQAYPASFIKMLLNDKKRTKTEVLAASLRAQQPRTYTLPEAESTKAAEDDPDSDDDSEYSSEELQPRRRPRKKPNTEVLPATSATMEAATSSSDDIQAVLSSKSVAEPRSDVETTDADSNSEGRSSTPPSRNSSPSPQTPPASPAPTSSIPASGLTTPLSAPTTSSSTAADSPVSLRSPSSSRSSTPSTLASPAVTKSQSSEPIQSIRECARRGRPSNNCGYSGCGTPVLDSDGCDGGRCDCCKRWFHLDHTFSTTCQAGNTYWACDDCIGGNHLRSVGKRHPETSDVSTQLTKRPRQEEDQSQAPVSPTSTSIGSNE